MDYKIPFIYIAETQRSRKIMLKYSYPLSHERQDSYEDSSVRRAFPCVRYNLNI
jgi:hypothetical protein